MIETADRLPDRHFPVGTLVPLLHGPHVTAPTATAVLARLDPIDPGSLPSDVMVVLHAVADRLIPQPGPRPRVDLAGVLAARLAAGEGDGWRYAELPDDADMIVRGMRAIDASAPGGFVALAPADQDRLLAEVQFNRVSGPAWRGLRADRAFEELLVALVEIYYGYPSGQEEIGYAGMADADGWSDPTVREIWEPQAIVGGSR